jgi:hypothetical protein
MLSGLDSSALWPAAGCAALTAAAHGTAQGMEGWGAVASAGDGTSESPLILTARAMGYRGAFSKNPSSGRSLTISGACFRGWAPGRVGPFHVALKIATRNGRQVGREGGGRPGSGRGLGPNKLGRCRAFVKSLVHVSKVFLPHVPPTPELFPAVLRLDELVRERLLLRLVHWNGGL